MCEYDQCDVWSCMVCGMWRVVWRAREQAQKHTRARLAVYQPPRNSIRFEFLSATLLMKQNSDS